SAGSRIVEATAGDRCPRPDIRVPESDATAQSREAIVIDNITTVEEFEALVTPFQAIDQVAIQRGSDGAGVAMTDRGLEVEVDAFVGVGHRQDGLAKVVLENPLTHVEDQGFGDGSEKTGVHLAGEGAERYHKASSLNAAL